jgi:hypothetical protein
MPDSNDIRAGGAFVEMSMRDEKFVAGLEHASRSLRHFSRTAHHLGEGLTLAGAAILGPIGIALHSLEKAKDHGGEVGQAAKDLTAAFEKMQESVLSVAAKLAQALLPTIRAIAERAQYWAEVVGRLIENNRELIVSALKAAAGVTAVGGALLAIGKIARFASAALELASNAISLLTSPTGLLLTAIAVTSVAAAAGLAYLWSRTEGGRQVIHSLAQDWSQAWEGMRLEIENGRISKAFKILWTTIKLSWYRFWDDIEKKMDDAIANMFGGKWGRGGLTGIWEQMKGGFRDMAAGARAIGTAMTEGLEKARKQFDKETGENHARAWKNINEQERKRHQADPRIAELEAELKRLVDAAKKENARVKGEIHAEETFDLTRQAKGTLSPFALYQSYGIGDDTTGKKIAEHTRQTAENTRQIRDAMSKGQNLQQFA